MTEGDRCNLIKILESVRENKMSANTSGRKWTQSLFRHKCIKAKTFAPCAEPLDLSHPPRVTEPTQRSAARLWNICLRASVASLKQKKKGKLRERETLPSRVTRLVQPLPHISTPAHSCERWLAPVGMHYVSGQHLSRWHSHSESAAPHDGLSLRGKQSQAERFTQSQPERGGEDGGRMKQWRQCAAVTWMESRGSHIKTITWCPTSGFGCITLHHSPLIEGINVSRHRIVTCAVSEAPRLLSTTRRRKLELKKRCR